MSEEIKIKPIPEEEMIPVGTKVFVREWGNFFLEKGGYTSKYEYRVRDVSVVVYDGVARYKYSITRLQHSFLREDLALSREEADLKVAQKEIRDAFRSMMNAKEIAARHGFTNEQLGLDKVVRQIQG